MQHRWLAISLTLLGCGDDPDANGEPPPPELADALEATRQSSAVLCATTDRCYPDLIETDHCVVGDTEFASRHQREWPAKAADSCWTPLFEKYEEAILSHLSCLQDANQEFEACLNSCPVWPDWVGCDNVGRAGPRSCGLEVKKIISRPDIDAYEACEARLAPEPD